MSIDARETWITFMVTKLKHHVLWYPSDLFTTESFIDRLDPALRPSDRRWSGLAFQRAKREGIIRELQVTDEGEDYGSVIVKKTRSGHKTAIWVPA